jgi:hypothetical protein
VSGPGWGNPVVGGTALRIPSIHSPNYVPGQTGWSINADGSAEFNNIVIRGGITSTSLVTGNTIVINEAGIFVYNGPARGLTPPTNAGGNGGSGPGPSIPNTCTVTLTGGESGQVWTKVSDDGTSTAIFTAVA